jgi:hypothetical protein
MSQPGNTVKDTEMNLAISWVNLGIKYTEMNMAISLVNLGVK